MKREKVQKRKALMNCTSIANISDTSDFSSPQDSSAQKVIHVHATGVVATNHCITCKYQL